MRSKILAILVIFVFCGYDFAYAHSGRTNAAGCHNVTATGGYHCHNGGGNSGSGGSGSSGGSSRGGSGSSRYSENESGIYILLGLTVIIGIGYWAYTTDWGKNPQGCGCLFSQTSDNQVLTRSLFNQTVLPINDFKFPELNLNRQGVSGWQLRAAYTFRF